MRHCGLQEWRGGRPLQGYGVVMLLRDGGGDGYQRGKGVVLLLGEGGGDSTKGKGG